MSATGDTRAGGSPAWRQHLRDGVESALYFVAFIPITALTVLNLFIGVIVSTWPRWPRAHAGAATIGMAAHRRCRIGRARPTPEPHHERRGRAGAGRGAHMGRAGRVGVCL